jgi:hypothetical protein
MRENKDIRMGNMVRDFVAQLDEMLMLESPRFEKAYQALRDEYHPLEIRHAMFAGRSYPAEPDQLKPYLDAQFTAAAEREAADDALPGDGARPRAVMAPHLDPRRTGEFCPIIRVSCKAFGIGRRVPIVGKYLS